jgi:hypothetical protein
MFPRRARLHWVLTCATCPGFGFSSYYRVGAFYLIAHHVSYSYARDAREGHQGWPFGAQAPGLDDARPRRRTRAGGSFCQTHFK